MSRPVGRLLFTTPGDDPADRFDSLRITATPSGLAVTIADRSVLLTRPAVQATRQALTEWLVDASPTAHTRAT